MSITWSPLAIDRVSEIAQYIADDKPEAANNWIDSIFTSVEKLSSFPQSGRIVPEFNKESIREILHGNYRVIYQISTSGIEILTARHGNQLLSKEDL